MEPNENTVFDKTSIKAASKHNSAAKGVAPAQTSLPTKRLGEVDPNNGDSFDH